MFSAINLHHHYKNKETLNCINFSITSGQIVSIVGPSGCGKTTLLRILAGVIKASKGELVGFTQDSSYVFQKPRLLPWCTVRDNVKFVLQDKLPAPEIEDRVQKTLEMVELKGISEHYPLKLSGGMQQRVAIARALALPSRLMFLDEPFQSLDFNLKQRLMKELIPLLSKQQYTVFLVTHDIRVAATMGDTVLVLSDAPATIIKQLKNPIDRVTRAANSRVLLAFENEIYSCLSKI
ncbi:ABC transporter ATP-binding protein [Clostridium sp. 'deep sea']|uniref:ABC transporter ATP-binding protein n=1 Tax=Clostridium sp. 'deep sea' TaxID=2779445 RepID=UPI0018964B8F|nr:ABC transporter ATP-binding protein [Clostridium sp. 'deep sea']QOR34006.1 ABC transporter ATP-binding protein [Clostridium sp. 'deep sea']